jgi:hypothetical protein
LLSSLSACLDAFRITGDIGWYDYATQALEWFFGRNALGVSMYDKASGGCRDGLHIDRLNENQGAESTLSLPDPIDTRDEAVCEGASGSVESQRKKTSPPCAGKRLKDEPVICTAKNKTSRSLWVGLFFL